MYSKAILIVFGLAMTTAVTCSSINTRAMQWIDQRTCRNSIEQPTGIEIVEAPTDQLVETGASVVLSCTAYAVPQAIIYWLHNGQPVTKVGRASENRFERIVSYGGPQIGTSITNSVMPLDCVDASNTGVFTCVVDNGCQRSLFNATVALEHDGIDMVCERDSDKGAAPKIITWTDIRIEGNTQVAQLYCRAQGVPKPKMTWSIGGNKANALTSLNGNERVKMLPNGDLLIEPLGPVGGGSRTFQCQAENKHGIDTQNVVFIQMVGW